MSLIVGTLVAAMLVGWVLWPAVSARRQKQFRRASAAELAAAGARRQLDRYLAAIRAVRSEALAGRLAESDASEVEAVLLARAAEALRAGRRATALPARGGEVQPG